MRFSKGDFYFSSKKEGEIIIPYLYVNPLEVKTIQGSDRGTTVSFFTKKEKEMKIKILTKYLNCDIIRNVKTEA